ncbi:hypothetical protein MTO96_014554 [Rhipicephalus appendiculatus]
MAKEPKGRSVISFNVKGSRSELSSSSKKSGSYYTTTRSTRESGSTTAPPTLDGTQVVVRASEHPAYRNAEQETGREKFLYPAALCLAFVLALVLCFLFWPKENPPAKLRKEMGTRYDSTCSSGACLRRAAYLSNILSWGDVEPCEHFDTFVCGQWRSRFSSAASYHATSTDDDYVEVLEEKVHAFLQNSHRSPSVAQPLKFLHDECMNVRRIDYEGVEALVDLMAQFSLKGFPLQTDPIGNNVSVWRTAAQLLRKTGTAALLTVGVASHPEVNNMEVVALGVPEVLTSFGHVEVSEVIRLYTEAVFSASKIVKREYVPPRRHSRHSQICQ